MADYPVVVEFARNVVNDKRYKELDIIRGWVYLEW